MSHCCAEASNFKAALRCCVVPCNHTICGLPCQHNLSCAPSWRRRRWHGWRRALGRCTSCAFLPQVAFLCCWIIAGGPTFGQGLNPVVHQGHQASAQALRWICGSDHAGNAGRQGSLLARMSFAELHPQGHQKVVHVVHVFDIFSVVFSQTLLVPSHFEH